jgi:hypothetical protein
MRKIGYLQHSVSMKSYPRFIQVIISFIIRSSLLSTWCIQAQSATFHDPPHHTSPLETDFSIPTHLLPMKMKMRYLRLMKNNTLFPKLELSALRVSPMVSPNDRSRLSSIPIWGLILAFFHSYE